MGFHTFEFFFIIFNICAEKLYGNIGSGQALVLLYYEKGTWVICSFDLIKREVQ